MPVFGLGREAVFLLCPTNPPAHHTRFRSADVRIDAPVIAPWDCLGPDGIGGVKIISSSGTGEPIGRTSSSSATSATAVTSPTAAVAAEATAAPAPSATAAADASAAPLQPLSSAPPLGAPLFEPSDRRSQQLLDQVVSKRGRDALLQLRKMLKDALRAEKITPAVRAKLSSSVTGAELEALTGSLAQGPGGRRWGAGVE